MMVTRFQKAAHPLGCRMGKGRSLLLFGIFFYFLTLTSSLYGFQITGATSPDSSGNAHEYIAGLLKAYESQSVQGTRIFLESGSKNRFRYEYFIRSADQKIVTLKMPFEVTWFRFEDEGYLVQNGTKTKVDVPLKDLEDLLIEKLKSCPITFSVSEVLYTGLPASFVVINLPDHSQYRLILMRDSYQFIKIEYEKADSLSIMLYEHLFPYEREVFSEDMNFYRSLPFWDDGTKTTDASIANSDGLGEGNAGPLSAHGALYYDFERFITHLVRFYTLANIEAQEHPGYSVLMVKLELEGNATPVALLLFRSKDPRNPSRIPEALLGTIPSDYEIAHTEVGRYTIYVFGEAEKARLESILDGLAGQAAEED